MARVLRLLSDEEIERIDAEMEAAVVTMDRAFRHRIATLREPISIGADATASMDLLGVIERLLLVFSIGLVGIVLVLA